MTWWNIERRGKPVLRAVMSAEQRGRRVPFFVRARFVPCFAHVRLLFIALVVACASGGRGETDTLPLDVMTFNIRYGTAEDSTNAWPHRRDLLMDVIAGHDPQVLGVQEALRFQLDELSDEFGDYGEIGVGRDDGAEEGEYAAILYDTERLEVLEQGTFWFSSTPETPGSISWGNRIPRISSWARFRDVTDSTTFYVYNVHWDHESQASRDSSAVLLLEHLAGRPAADPVIVMGDFNAGEANSAFRTILASASRVEGAPRVLDTFRAIHPSARNVGTYHGFRGGGDGEKIDAVLVSTEWDVIAASIDRTAEDGRYPSDHYPVTARIILR